MSASPKSYRTYSGSRSDIPQDILDAVAFAEAQAKAEKAEKQKKANAGKNSAAESGAGKAQGAAQGKKASEVNEEADTAKATEADEATEDAAVDEAENPEATDAEEVAKAKAEVKDWQDKYMRLHAEWDTYRRRTAEQREAERARAGEKLVESLLPVIDDLERSVDYAEKNGTENLLDGVKAVHTKFVDVLKSGGVEVICPEGEAFDALECQAVATVEDTSVFDETVHEVYQKGYKMGNKVLRPAMVTVTSGGSKRPSDKPDSDSQD